MNSHVNKYKTYIHNYSTIIIRHKISDFNFGIVGSEIFIKSGHKLGFFLDFGLKTRSLYRLFGLICMQVHDCPFCLFFLVKCTNFLCMLYSLQVCEL